MQVQQHISKITGYMTERPLGPTQLLASGNLQQVKKNLPPTPPNEEDDQRKSLLPSEEAENAMPKPPLPRKGESTNDVHTHISRFCAMPQNKE